MESINNPPSQNGETPSTPVPRQAPNITLSIERVVFDGYSHGDSLLIKESMERTLHALCTEQGHMLNVLTSSSRERLSTVSVPVTPTSLPRVLGESIARMIFKRLRHG